MSDSQQMRFRHVAWGIAACVFLLTLLPYLRTGTFDFVNYDDRDYVYDNPHVIAGLSVDSVKWVFSSEPTKLNANWHPLTFLSLLTDVSLFGVAPGAIHLHNAVLHAVDSVLLFFFLVMLLEAVAGGRGNAQRSALNAQRSTDTKTLLACGLAALFWSLHPLRVESVAWVSSRKDVLCLLFLLPGLMAYLKNLTSNRAFYLFISGICFLCAFMSKPTAVVYPLLAVMLEFLLTGKVTWRRNEILVWLMLVLMGVTYIVQDVGKATVSGLSLLLRMENAVAGVGHYVTTTVFPNNLTVFYKYEIPVPVRRLVPGGLFLLAVLYYFLNVVFPAAKDWFVAKRRAGVPGEGHASVCPREPGIMSGEVDAQTRVPPLSDGRLSDAQAGVPGEGHASACPREPGIVSGEVDAQTRVPPVEQASACSPHLTAAFGILWFGLALGPVVGLVQVGFASCADRYTYLPGIGLSIILALVLGRAFGLAASVKGPALGLMVAVLAVLSVLTWRQIGTWKDTFTLFEHAIKVTRENYVAHCNVGFDFQMDGNNEKALDHFLKCAKYMLSEMELKGIVPVHKEKNMENLAATIALLNGAKLVKSEAGPCVEKTNIFEKEIRSDEPQAALRIFALGLYAYYKELDGLAEQNLKRAREMDPSDGYVWRFLGFLYERQGRFEEAVGMYEKSQALEPDKDVAKRIRRLKERGGQHAGEK